MTAPVKPTKKPRGRVNGASLIAASNAFVFLAVLVILIGIFTNDGVVIAGIVIAVIAIVLSFVNASRRRARIRKAKEEA